MQMHITITVIDTYDVQLVNGTILPQDGGVELSCTFAEGSHAQSCILSICRMEDDIEEPCMNITINREENTVNGQIINLQPGLYIIREVAEVESDGQLTFHRKKNVLELRVNEPPHLGLYIHKYHHNYYYIHNNFMQVHPLSQ